MYTSMNREISTEYAEYAKTKILQESFLVRGPHYWNSLLPHLTEC